jgi:outer membrane protein assembly factor BamB
MRRLSISNFTITLVFGLALLLCLEACTQVFAQTPSAVSDAIEGKWYGMAGFPQDRVEIGFEFKRNEKQELKAYLYQPVMNFYGLELPGALKKEADKYVLEDVRMSLTFSEGKLSGTYYPLHAPISLERTRKLPAEVPLPSFPKGPGPKWQAKLGAAIYAPAAVHDGIAYVGTTGGMFYAISLKDGSYVWPFTAGRPIHGEALVSAEHVYFVCDNGFLFKLDRKTGKEVWRYDLGDAQVPRTLPHQVLPNSGDYDWNTHASRPVLVDEVIYVGSGDGSMHAVNAAKGERIWRSEPRGKIRTAAVVDGPRVIFGSLDDTVYAVDRQTGREVWKKNTYGPLTSSPILIDGKLIVGNRNGLLAALNPATGETVWRMLFWGSSVESDAVPAGDGSLFYIGSSDLRRISLIDAKDARVLWRTDIFGWAWPRPALSDKLVYASAIGASPYQMRHLGSLTAMDRKTGKIVWRWPMPEAPGSWTNGFAASPAIDGNTLVVGGLDGTLYAFPVE